MEAWSSHSFSFKIQWISESGRDFFSFSFFQGEKKKREFYAFPSLLWVKSLSVINQHSSPEVEGLYLHLEVWRKSPIEFNLFHQF